MRQKCGKNLRLNYSASDVVKCPRYDVNDAACFLLIMSQ